jgi:hypothetical protein
MPMDTKLLSQSMIAFLKSNPTLFARCDRDGKENPAGEFWCAREGKTAGGKTDEQTVGFYFNEGRKH